MNKRKTVNFLMFLLVGCSLLLGFNTDSYAKANKLKVTCSKKTIYVGKTTRIKANMKVTYKSSNKKIATVNQKGIVKGKKAGKVKITIKTKKYIKKINIVVKKKATTRHTHKWEPIIKHHKAVYKTVVTPAVVHYYYCRNCQCTYPTIHEDPCEANGTISGSSCQEVISPYREEQVLVQEAYDEVIGYRCSCGATK